VAAAEWDVGDLASGIGGGARVKGMGKDSAISWTTHTFNPWHGCTFIEGDPACAPPEGEDGSVCYAKTWSERCGYSETGTHFPIWGANADRRYFGDKHWNEPLKWNAASEKSQERARVFCMSMGDWAEGRPDQTEHLERLWRTIPQTPWLDWLMLTKRPQLINKLCPLRNHPTIWQGVTAVTQKWLDLRWEHLKRVEARVYWLSVEPLQERMKLPGDFLALASRAWVIVGGPSGTNIKPMDPGWARDLRDQCLDHGVAFHMKQMSGTTKKALEAIPSDLMIRQYPINVLDESGMRRV
jgi:protein gp37